MRKCLRCQTEMVGDLITCVRDVRLGLASEFSEIKGTNVIPSLYIDAAVCPKCGYVEFYTYDFQSINEIKTKREQKKNDRNTKE